MYPDTDYGPRRSFSDRSFRAAGVAPAWRVVAILAIITSGVFLFACFWLGVALVISRNGPSAATPSAPATTKSLKALQPVNGGEDEDIAEPPNPYYPVVADLCPPEAAPIPGELRPGHRETSRERFLKLGTKVSTFSVGSYPRSPRVSPDGQSLAWASPKALAVEPLTREIGPDAGGNRPGTYTIAGAPSWSADGKAVYFTDATGMLNRYLPQRRNSYLLPFHGECPAAVPGETQNVVFARARLVPKVDLPGMAAPADPVEVVLGDTVTGTVRVLVAEGKTNWSALALSPDGKHLALVSAPAEGERGFRQQLFLCDLGPEKPAQPKPFGPATASMGAIYWTEDGRAVIYESVPSVLPPDHWEADNAAGWGGMDLYLADVGTGKQTKLSRGGGFVLAGVDRGGDLFYLESNFGLNGGRTTLRRVSLTAARNFAAGEPERPARDRQAWTEVVDQTLKAAEVAFPARGEDLAPRTLSRLADAFATAYQERFQTEAPKDLGGWERLQRELRVVEPPGPIRSRLVLILGAAEGEYLHRQHGATWHLAKGPLVVGRPTVEGAPEESPFAVTVNPFESAGFGIVDPDDEDDRGLPFSSLSYQFLHARGRTLVLSNDPAAGRQAVDALADPDLARAAELLSGDRVNEGERVVLDLVKRPEHARNEYLALHAGKLLHERGRHEALRRLLEALPEPATPDKQRYNLLGLALLETNPQAAIAEFKNALRCDLYYTPGYLNLSQAYEKAGDRQGALACAERCLKLSSFGPQAATARQRLAALQPHLPPN